LRGVECSLDIMIKNFVFDLGGVLIDWNPRYLYRKILQSEKEVERFLAEVCTHYWNVQQDTGRLIEDAEKELIYQFPGKEALIKAYYGRWEESLKGPIIGSVEILSQLKEKSYSLYALSNWSAETYPIAQKHYEFLDWFDGEVISGRVKMVKPNPEIYLYLLENFQLNPEETFFIDDSVDNVEQAEMLGIQGFRFTDPYKLNLKLQNLGIL
jgi:2-haloacid dehalogenase